MPLGPGDNMETQCRIYSRNVTRVVTVTTTAVGILKADKSVKKNDRLKQVDKFKYEYLGSTITEKRGWHDEVRFRVCAV